MRQTLGLITLGLFVMRTQHVLGSSCLVLFLNPIVCLHAGMSVLLESLLTLAWHVIDVQPVGWRLRDLLPSSPNVLSLALNCIQEWGRLRYRFPCRSRRSDVTCTPENCMVTWTNAHGIKVTVKTNYKIVHILWLHSFCTKRAYKKEYKEIYPNGYISDVQWWDEW